MIVYNETETTITLDMEQNGHPMYEEWEPRTFTKGDPKDEEKIREFRKAEIMRAQKR